VSVLPSRARSRLQAPGSKAVHGRPLDRHWGFWLGPLSDPAALQQEGSGLPFHFFDNVDPQGFQPHPRPSLIGYRPSCGLWVASRAGRPSHIGMEQARAALEQGRQLPAQEVPSSMAGSPGSQAESDSGWPASKCFDWVGGAQHHQRCRVAARRLIVCRSTRFLAGLPRWIKATRVADLEANPAP